MEAYSTFLPKRRRQCRACQGYRSSATTFGLDTGHISHAQDTRCEGQNSEYWLERSGRQPKPIQHDEAERKGWKQL